MRVVTVTFQTVHNAIENGYNSGWGGYNSRTARCKLYISEANRIKRLELTEKYLAKPGTEFRR